MSEEQLCYLSVADLSRLIASRQVSPVSVVQATLDRIEKLDSAIRAYITVTGEAALEAAREAEREIAGGGYRGPLHGVPVSLKDIVYLKGVRNTAGSKLLADFVPDYDAAVTEKLLAAGAIVVGKTQMYEFAMGPMHTCEPDYTRNPWDLSRVPGGSSSGSGAAVSAGLCYASIGTDTGGSVRGPASVCGVVGLKATYGRVSRYGVTPQSWSMDHVGPLTRTVTDCALVMNAIAGYDPRDPGALDAPVPDFTSGLDGDVRGLRVGILSEFFGSGLDPEFEAAVRQATRVLESAGATLQEVSLPTARHAQTLYMAIVPPEAASIHEERIRTRAHLFGPDARTKTELGSFVLATDYLKAQRVRTVLQREFASAMREVDVLVAPTTNGPPARLDELAPKPGKPLPPLMETNPFRRAFSLIGTPAISVPCGFSSGGLPVGLQIVGRPMEDETVLKVAHAYEQLTDWHTRRPPVG